MAAKQLNQQMRKEAVTNMLKDVFTDKVVNFQERVQAFIRQYFNHVTADDQKWYGNLTDHQKKMVSTVKGIRMYRTVEGNNNAINLDFRIMAFVGRHPEDSTYNDKIKSSELISQPFNEYESNDFYRLDRKIGITIDPDYEDTKQRFPYVGGSDIGIMEVKGVAVKEMISFEKERKQLTETIANAGEQFYAALQSVTNVAKLEEVVPEAVKYLPAPQPKPKSTQIAPADLYKSVNALLSNVT